MAVSRLEHNTSVVEAFSEPVTFLTRTHVLWSKPDEVPSTLPSRCPSMLLYEDTLSASYQNGERTYELPPTFEARITHIQGFSAQSKYLLTVCVARRRQSTFRKSDVREKYAIPLVFPRFGLL